MQWPGYSALNCYIFSFSPRNEKLARIRPVFPACTLETLLTINVRDQWARLPFITSHLAHHLHYCIFDMKIINPLLSSLPLSPDQTIDYTLYNKSLRAALSSCYVEPSFLFLTKCSHSRPSPTPGSASTSATSTPSWAGGERDGLEEEGERLPVLLLPLLLLLHLNPLHLLPPSDWRRQ